MHGLYAFPLKKEYGYIIYMDARKKLSRDFSPGNSSLFDTVRGLSYFKPFDFG